MISILHWYINAEFHRRLVHLTPVSVTHINDDHWLSVMLQLSVFCLLCSSESAIVLLQVSLAIPFELSYYEL